MVTESRSFIKRRERTLPITEIEHTAFCKVEDDLPAKPLLDELRVNVRWQKIPLQYLHLTADELDRRISEAKEKLGEKVIILGHHYQREEVINYADIQGDSYLLSRAAASQPKADYIVFCGVHFMAETASVLAAPHQRVILPNITAGCSMSDMATTGDVLDAWDDLEDVLGSDGGILPITYMNSTAEIKALCGRHGGIVCTSSNAAAVFDWAFQRAERILFLPDQHLGRNTGLKAGIDINDMVVWDPFKALGGHTTEEIRAAKIILWQGHCAVHTRFSVKQIQAARQRHPDIKVIVHPECTMETVQSADIVGSTEVIRKTINEASPGSKWAVGTEISLVNRLSKNNPDKVIFCLDPIVCPCSTMYRIHPAYLSWVLDGLLEGVVVNEINVKQDIRDNARIALERMLQAR